MNEVKLTDSQMDDLACRISDNLCEKRKDFWIPGEEHYKDHMDWRQYRAAVMREEDERRASNARVKEQVVGWLSISAITLMVGYLGYTALLAIHDLWDKVSGGKLPPGVGD